MGRIGMNDLISRQAVIAFLQSIPYIKEHPNMGELMKEWIEQIPSVQPMKRQGKSLLKLMKQSAVG